MGFIVTRTRGAQKSNALTAAAVPIKPSQAVTLKSPTGKQSRAWQTEAWAYYGYPDPYLAVGEWQYYVCGRANACARTTLIASAIDSNGRPTKSIPENDQQGQRVAQIVQQIAGGTLGQSELIRRIAESLSICGEVWVAVIAETNDTYSWYALTEYEFEKRVDQIILKLPNGTDYTLNWSKDSLIRIWVPDARNAREPTSQVRGVLPSLREISTTTSLINTSARSRLASNGILPIPMELSLPGGNGKAVEDPAQSLQDLLILAAEKGEQNPNDLSAVVPLIVSVPGEYINDMKHISLHTDLIAEQTETRKDAIKRFALGVDVSPERLLGAGAANHWSLWVITDQDVQLHVAPLMELICKAFYTKILWKVIEQEGIDPAKYTLWYDTSDLTADPDKSDDAQEAFNSGAITAKALIKHRGLADEDLYDWDSEQGRSEWIRDQLSRRPNMLYELAKAAGLNIDLPEQGATGQGRPRTGREKSDADKQQEPSNSDVA